MLLIIKREAGDATCVQGELFIEGQHECWTLERLRHDPVSSTPYGKMCCIPPTPKGVPYEVVMRYSPHFKCDMPHVLNVPGRQDIEIHAGNWVKNSEGCPLVGHQKSHDMLLDSATESKELNAKLAAVITTGDRVWLEVIEPEGSHA